MKKNKLNVGLVLLSGTLLIACGGGGGGGGAGSSAQQQEQENVMSDGSNIKGIYLGKLRTLNSHVVGTIPGSAQILRNGNKLSTFVRLFAGSPSIAHFQNVHMGSRCPTMDDDKNRDGYIDITEANAAVGKIIIPLDWDIGSQSSGNRAWPKAFPNGSYEYMKVTNFDRFWRDLKSVDIIKDDNVVKLSPNGGFSLVGRVVIIQGVSIDKNLPESVAGYKRWKNYQTLPIACAILKPHQGNVGTPYQDVTPGSVAEVQEGQDRPAPEGSYEIPGTGTVIIPGPSNDAGSNDSDSEDDNTPDDDGDWTPFPPVPNPNPTPNPDPDDSPWPQPDPTPEPDDGDDNGDDDGDNDDDDDDGNGWCWPWETDCR